MTNNRYLPLCMAVRIWLLATLFNALLGTLFLCAIFGAGLAFFLLFYGLGLGLLVSLPAFVLIFLVIQRCRARQYPATTIYRATLIASLLLAVIAWLIYRLFFNESIIKDDYVFLALAIVSGITATSTQYNAFTRLANYSEPFQEV